MGEERRHFSREFKQDAVQLVTEKGMPVGKVARELDIHPSLLHLWRRRFSAQGDKAFVGKGCATPEEVEIKGLRKQLEKVRPAQPLCKAVRPLFASSSMVRIFD
jgi:transposase